MKSVDGCHVALATLPTSTSRTPLSRECHVAGLSYFKSSQ